MNLNRSYPAGVVTASRGSAVEPKALCSRILRAADARPDSKAVLCRGVRTATIATDGGIDANIGRLCFKHRD